MERKIAKFPNWTFNLDEISAGVYKLNGRNDLGCTVELTGIDPDKLIAEATSSAENIEQDLKTRRSR
jgi:hypothetical protein